MNHPQDTGAFTAVSGIIGGVIIAISDGPVMMAITFGSLANMMINVAASTGIGYIVKKHSIRFQGASDQSLTKIQRQMNKYNTPKSE